MHAFGYSLVVASTLSAPGAFADPWSPLAKGDAPAEVAPLATGDAAAEVAPLATGDAPAEVAPPAATSPAPSAPAATPAAAKINLVPATPPCEPCRGAPDRDASEGSGSFLLGAALLDLSALNDRLAASGYQRIPSVMTFIGGEGRAVFPSGFIAGARGGALINPGGQGPGNMRTHFGGGFGLVDFGFALVHTQPILLSLTGGIGGYGLSLGIGDEQSVRFDTALANPRQSLTLSRGGLLAGLTLGLDGRVPMGPAEHGRRGLFTMGLRVGGLYGPALGAWGLAEGSNATAGPSTGLTGGYALLALGFGGGNVETPP